jgi:hypothetical protein
MGMRGQGDCDVERYDNGRIRPFPPSFIHTLVLLLDVVGQERAKDGTGGVCHEDASLKRGVPDEVGHGATVIVVEVGDQEGLTGLEIYLAEVGERVGALEGGV